MRIGQIYPSLGRPAVEGELTGGSAWHINSGVPDPGLYEIGDFYLDSDNGDVYEKTDTDEWTLRGNLTGPAGPAGDDGPVGPQGDDGLPRQVQDEGSNLTIRDKLNFIGDGVTATDDSANDRTNITIPGGGGSGGHEIQEEGTPLAQRAGLNFIGAAVTATDDSANDRTNVTIVADAETLPASLIDAKGDLIVGTSDNTPDRLAVGSDDQVLIADSTVSKGMRWGAVTSGLYIPYSLIDAAGDLLVGSADNTVIRKAVGADGTILVADSGHPGGVKWAAGGGLSFSFRTTHTFLIGDFVTDTTIVPDFHVAKTSTQTITIVQMIARLESGTSIDVALRRNAGAVGSAQTITTTKQTFTYSQALSDGDAIDVVFSSPTADPANLSVTIVLEHVVTA